MNDDDDVNHEFKAGLLIDWFSSFRNTKKARRRQRRRAKRSSKLPSGFARMFK